MPEQVQATMLVVRDIDDVETTFYVEISGTIARAEPDVGQMTDGVTDIVVMKDGEDFELTPDEEEAANNILINLIDGESYED